MAISNTGSRNTYTLDSVTTDFDITFDVVFDDNGDATELTVWLIDSEGNRTEIEKGYASDQYTVAYKTVTYLDATAHEGDTLLITRATPRTQLTDFINNGAYNLDQVEAMSDKLTRIVQEQDATIEDRIQTSEEFAEAAAESADNAYASEQKAHDWADKAPDVEVETGEYSAKHWASKSATSASNASTSETNAGLSETAAAGSAEDSEAWAVGKRGGTDVPPTDPTYQNNSRYYAEVAAHYASGGMRYIGTWDTTGATDYSAVGTPRVRGDVFYVQGSGCTIDGVDYTLGDIIIINQDIAAGTTITTSAIDKIDNTETVTPNNVVTLTNKTISAKYNTIKEYRPAIGVPTLWMGTKPDWALDFGNGATTQYLWANYPELDTPQFKDILDHFKTTGGSGLCADYDAEGFYVPDLRGMMPRVVGTNGTYNTDAIADVGAVMTERLPNIYGYIADGVFSPENGTSHSGATTSGALSTTVRSGWSLLGGGSFGYRGPMYVQAKNTTGTGNGVYLDDAHVSPLSFGAMYIVRYE